MPRKKTTRSTRKTSVGASRKTAAARSRRRVTADSTAEVYARDPRKLQELFEAAVAKASTVPMDQFKDSWAYLQAMLRLLRAYYRNEYRKVPWTGMAAIIGAIIYFVNPLDLIPDSIFGLGYLDDVAIIGFTLRSVKGHLDDFMAWETSIDR
jgi:uncharacterized membrane protein YkvA (DUF1232 family)